MTSDYVLPGHLFPHPRTLAGDLDAPHWDGLTREELLLQKCRTCGEFQWLPEWVCYRCLSRDLGFEAVAPTGRIYSWVRVWNPPGPEFVEHVPYLVLAVRLDEVPAVRLIGNLVGDQTAGVEIGSAVDGVFEHHDGFSLLQWRGIRV